MFHRIKKAKMNTYKNPNPLTKEKLKTGVIFGKWLFTKNQICGRYTLKRTSSIDDCTTGEYMLISEVSDDFIECRNIFLGAVVNASISLNSLCIIEEAPKESEVKS